MGETSEILALWRKAAGRGEKVALATVVHVEGSSYRKPGARMLVTSAGERAGTVSGGCLETEVARKIWWLTARGPAIHRYQSSLEEDGGEVSWGLGCGGTVSIHLEQQPAAVLEALAASNEQGVASVILFPLTPPSGSAVRVSRAGAAVLPIALASTVVKAFDTCQSIVTSTAGSSSFVEYLAPPPRLTIFGAGDDAKPIAEFAAMLGWRLAVADGRAHLLQPSKFPASAELRPLTWDSPPVCGPDCSHHTTPKALETGVAPGELAVLLTHSYEQDRAILGSLLPKDLLYLGILGPRHRTERLLKEVAPMLHWTVEQCFARLHSPVGLDLGAHDPASIALSIVAGLQAALTRRSLTVIREPAPARAMLHA